MAEDKRIRINVDYSELDQLREKIRSLTFELNRMGENFGGVTPDRFQTYANQVVDLQEQALRSISSGDNQFRVFDRAWDRFSMGYQAANPDWRSRLTPTEPLSPGASDRVADAAGNRGLWGRITDFLSRIANSLEKENRDRENGEVPIGDTPQFQPQNTPQPVQLPNGEPPQQDRVDWEKALKNFNLPTSIGGLLGMFTGGVILAQIGQMIGNQAQFSAQQYGAENRFQRQNNMLNHFLLNAFTFGISGAEASKKEAARAASERNDMVLREISAYEGISYRGALKRQLEGVFGEDYENVLAIEEDRNKNKGIFNSLSKFGLKEISREPGGDWARKTLDEMDEVSKQAYEARKNSEGRLTKDEYQNWASDVLGLNITDYWDKVLNLQKFGVSRSNIDVGNVNQLLLAEVIRGLSEEQLSSIQEITRFANKNVSGSRVVQALDKNLQVMGYDSRYINSVLPEELQRFTQVANQILEKGGKFDADSIVRTMTGIRQVTGMEGRQLDRVTNSLMGGTFSQDDVSQGLLYTIAREIAGPNAAVSDLEAMIETMGDDADFQKNIYKRIRQMAGGNREMQRQTMKSVFGMSMSDVIALEEALDEELQKPKNIGKNPEDVLFEGGTSVWQKHLDYNEYAAKSMVGDALRSSAGTQNRKIINGYDNLYGSEGKSLKEVLESIDKPIPVMLTGEDLRKVVEAVVHEYRNFMYNNEGYLWQPEN